MAEARERVVDVLGTTAMTNEIAALAFSVLGKPPRISRLPACVLRAAAAMTRPFNENLATFLKMFALLGDGFDLAPAHGTHHLADHFRSLA